MKKSKLFSVGNVKYFFYSFVMVMCAFIVSSSSFSSYSYTINEDEEYIYLSDLDYIESDSSAYYGVKYDSNSNGAMSTLIVDGVAKVFAKSVTAWAPSVVVYDISEISDMYTLFSAYVGIDYSQQNTYFNNGAGITIYVSDDKEEWIDLEIDGISSLTAYMESVYVNVSVEGYNYIKFEGSTLGTNWWSHWYDDVTYANAKFTKEGYVEDITYNDGVKTVSEYDELILSYTGNKDSDDYRHLLLKRDFVSKANYDVIQSLLMINQDYVNSILWIFNDYDNLKEFTLGGTPDGSYFNALKIWDQLYNEFKEDLYQEGYTNQGIAYSDLNRKMLYSLTLTHSTTVGLWAGGKTGNPEDPNDSKASVRYTIFKNLHDEGKLDDYIFDFLEIEEMRFVMNNIVDDESIEWFNYYIAECNGNNRNPYQYITYGDGYYYLDNQYYTEENYEKWDSKYNLTMFDITYEYGYPKPWIVMEEGGVCGAISKTGSNILGSFGIPSSVISQPGHAAYIVYSLNGDGIPVYSIWNNITGWGQSGKTEKLSVRMPNGWGSGNYVSAYPASYMLISQEALNDFEEYEASELILLETGVYKDNFEKLEEIYWKAISASSINLDAWIGLVDLYLADTSKTEDEINNLLVDIMDNLLYHPRPMYDLVTNLSKALSSAEYIAAYNIKLNDTLTYQTKVTSAESYQDLAVREVSTYILGLVDNDVATFSFSGEEAGVLKLASQFEGSNVTWDYSLDGGITYTLVTTDSIKLTEEEIESINVDNDIIVHIVGLNYNTENLFYIDVLDGLVPSNIYNNDNENIVAGATSDLEWRMQGSSSWTGFDIASPELTGNVSVEVRTKPIENYVASNYVTLSYLENLVVEERSYVSITRQSVFDYSTAQDAAGHYASNALDGNIHTIWHSTYDGDDFDRYITIELDKSIYLSALEYVPRLSATNGIVGAAELYGSSDGVNFELLTTATGWGSNSQIKYMELEDSTLVKYIKFKATETYSTDSRTFISALMFNIYEDTTKIVTPTASVSYDVSVSTNKNVTATLVNPSEEIIVTNNDGSTEYVFEKNGSFTFEFESLSGATGTAVATVKNIDKDAPILTVTYSDTDLINTDVVATISANENITVLNNNGKTEYSFASNGTFVFQVVDKAGNESSITAKVSNIDKIKPTASLSYSTTTETTGSVVVNVVDISEELSNITNSGKYTFTKNGSYTFEFTDKAGNTNYITATVDWIKEESNDTSTDEDEEGDTTEPLEPENEDAEFDDSDEPLEEPDENIFDNLFQDDDESKEDLEENKDNVTDDLEGNEDKKFNWIPIVIGVFVFMTLLLFINKKPKNKEL
ncbi:MAG: NPCBM/NEW2 domain-containing protein [bacterium]